MKRTVALAAEQPNGGKEDAAGSPTTGSSQAISEEDLPELTLADATGEKPLPGAGAAYPGRTSARLDASADAADKPAAPPSGAFGPAARNTSGTAASHNLASPGLASPASQQPASRTSQLAASQSGASLLAAAQAVASQNTAEVQVTGQGLPIEQVMRAAQEPAPEVKPPPVQKLQISPGGRLGRYQLLEQIGEGGMATIFRARDTLGGRIVAVKALHAHQSQTLAGRRFHREFRAIHRLVHPHIVQVYDYAVEQGQPFIAMEYVNGHDLKHHLKDLRALAPAERWRQVEDLLRQICDALEFIHARGLIHRDLKPSNILLTPDRKAKLTDFGVAKKDDVSVQLTQAGMLVGTLAYLAPEVFEQKGVDHRVDLYALGVMLYVMLTDKLPFSGKNIAQIMQKHLKHDPEPPLKLNPSVPEHLDRITMKLLAKDPAQRHQSAAEVIRALEAARELGEAARVVEQQSTDYCWIPRLVGRSDALGSMREVIGLLSRGRGGILVVEGTEGVGKSRLVETGLSLAQPQGITVSYGRCLAGGQVWGEGLRGLVSGVASEVERTGAAPDVLPSLVQRFGVADLPAPTMAPQPQSDGLEDDICALFASLTRQHPRIIWLDDFEQADVGTLSAVTKLGRQLVRAGAPLLLVLTMRLASGPITPFVKQLLTGESTGVRPRQIGLGPLGRSEVLELIESMYPRDPRGALLAQRLHQESAGNPLAIVEIIRLLVARGKMGRRLVEGERRWMMALTDEELRDQLQLPRGIPSLLQSRLAAYPTQTRTLLRLIAVWGREIRFKTLLRLASASEEAVLAHLDRLVADGWLVEDWLGGDDRYVLAHPAYRAVLLSELTASDQSRLRGFIDMRLGSKREA